MTISRRHWLELAGAGAVGVAAPPSWTVDDRRDGSAPGRVTAADQPGKAAGRSRKLRILVLGGTGFIGPHQVRYALGRGHTLTLFNRGRRPQQWPAAVEELVGDRDAGDLKALAGREWDVCIDNPTTLPFWVRDAGRALKASVGHYVFISTLSVYASDAAAGQDESAPLAAYKGEDAMKETQQTLRANLEGLYGPLKALSERETEKWFPGRTTIIRPGLIVGPGDESDRFTYWPVRLARGGAVLAPGDGTDPVQFIDARDLAEWTVRVAEARALGTFNAMGPSSMLTMKGMVEEIRSAVGSKADVVWVPEAFLAPQKVSPWSDMPVWVPGSGDTAGFARRRNDKAIAAGLTFRPLDTTARDTLAWFRTQPPERQASPRAGISAEREQQVLAAWRAKTEQGPEPRRPVR